MRQLKCPSCGGVAMLASPPEGDVSRHQFAHVNRRLFAPDEWVACDACGTPLGPTAITEMVRKVYPKPDPRRNGPAANREVRPQ